MAPRSSGFPRRYSVPFLLFGLGLVAGGFTLWWPQRSGPSTAQSDLGLALLGGGLAVVAGFLVSLAVFSAQRRLDATLQATEERHERENLKMALSMADDLRGVDLHGRNLEGLRLVEKQMDGANFERANLRRAELRGVVLQHSRLADADLRDARITIGPGQWHTSLYQASLRGADLRGAYVRADLRRADLIGADLRGAQLGRAMFKHEREAGEEAALRGARYDSETVWPNDFEPDAWGAVRVHESD
jgi:uncharacterized protein YjbI with pentapeptide repeats